METEYNSVYNTRKKETEKDKTCNKEEIGVVIHRQTGHHIITSEICHYTTQDTYKLLQNKVVPAKFIISLVKYRISLHQILILFHCKTIKKCMLDVIASYTGYFAYFLSIVDVI